MLTLLTYVVPIARRYAVKWFVLIICIFIPKFIFGTTTIVSGYSIFDQLKYPENFTHFEYVNPNAPRGGIIKQAHIGTFDSLNDMIILGMPANGIIMTFDTLLKKSLDELGSYYGLIAQSLEVPQDKSWVIFNLRKAAFFHDNTPITADDVIFSFSILKEKGAPRFKLILNEISKAEKLTDYKVKFYIKNPSNPEIISYLGSLPILSKNFFKDKDFAKFTDEPILGSGPYKIDSYKFGQYIKYKRVDNYWGKGLPVNVGQYNFDYIQYDSYMDHSVAASAFKSKAFDFYEENYSKSWANEYNIKEIAKGEIIKESIPHKLPPNWQMYFINLRRPYLQDITLRKALVVAFDFDWLNKNLFYSLYQRMTSYYENTIFQAPNTPPQGEELAILNKYRDQLPTELFNQAFIMPFTGAAPDKNRDNLKRVKQELLDVGYEVQDNYLINPIDHKPVVLEMIYSGKSYERIILAYKNNLAKIGITLIPRMLDFAQLEMRSKNFDFDLIAIAFTPNILPGNMEYQIWHSSSDVKGGYNVGGVRNKVVDELVDKLRLAQNQKERIIYAHALDRVLLWNYYTVPNYYQTNFRLVYWNKFGIPDQRPLYEIGLETWWSKQ